MVLKLTNFPIAKYKNVIRCTIGRGDRIARLWHSSTRGLQGTSNFFTPFFSQPPTTPDMG